MRAVEAVIANQSSVRREGSKQRGRHRAKRTRQHRRAGTITQSGDHNAAYLIQLGRGLDGSIVQVGDNQSNRHHSNTP
jgi:hypothetical protein